MGGTVVTRRERLQDATRAEIKEVARRQMARGGAASLSLRAIAGEMGLTAPALYRYYPSRDDLITALIVDAFHALGDAIEGARQAVPDDAFAEQFVAMMTAYRAWALAHPADFTLIYGTPIPGYHAPEDVTDPAVRRSLAPLLTLLVAASRAGAITPAPEYAAAPAGLRGQFGGMLPPGHEGSVPPAALHAAFVAWAHLQGLIMLELFGHIAPVIGDPEPFYRYEVEVQLARLGLRSPA
jgi:AcrR family transcriptional regulator